MEAIAAPFMGLGEIRLRKAIETTVQRKREPEVLAETEKILADPMLFDECCSLLMNTIHGKAIMFAVMCAKPEELAQKREAALQQLRQVARSMAVSKVYGRGISLGHL